MVGLGDWSKSWHGVEMYLTNDILLLIPVAVLCAMPLHKRIGAWYERRVAALSLGPRTAVEGVASFAGAAGLLVVLFLCASYMASGTHNPFIYFQF